MTHSRRTFTALALTLCMAATAFAQQQATLHSAIDPAPKAGNKWWMDRHEKMNTRVAEGNVDLLMIGDSITHGWEGAGKATWEKYYGKRNAVNLGIGGDRTQHVIWRLQNGNIKEISPKLAVIMIGTNNSGDNTPEEIAEGIEAIVTLLRKELPEMKVLILAVFSRGPNNDDPRRQVNEKTNAIVEKLADAKTVHFLNINAKFLKEDGTLPKEIMPDLLHPKERGYAIWAEAVEPTIAKLMGEK